ncbi:unnamed protein product [Aphanomyces euteiches]|uniref:Fe2OG dioxygenase domain-containing protein n=1 Tax=Aphanomyces euteiches TaxID=100861 RepID=A0A6G0XAZ9_9STRA|nr:hypothetical protein Ae201684_006487 [Aphanomyces euteiches]KAH9091204.1 hypothetical protein Ae201684P_006604 [Aphanomyces euteiches]KAH9133523.1 hypothetical protein AeRB84_020426 [Aphanomyces euteiches]
MPRKSTTASAASGAGNTSHGAAFQYQLEGKSSPQYASSFLAPDIPIYAAQPDLDTLYDGSIQRLRFFMTKAECQEAMTLAARIGFTHVFHPQTAEYAFRDNDRLLLKSPELAAQIWHRLEPFLPDHLSNAVGCNPAIKFYRYRTGQAFGCHVDESVVDPDTKLVSQYTVLIYLNDANDSALQGGETKFYTSTTSRKKKTIVERETVLEVSPQTGMVLMHGHGEHCLEHEGARVHRGEKYVLRTDLMFEP